MKNCIFVTLALATIVWVTPSCKKEVFLPDITGYPIVGTNQSTAYKNSSAIPIPSEGEDFYGQNANYPGTTLQYVGNGEGTVTDEVTGLIWQQSFDHNEDGSID